MSAMRYFLLISCLLSVTLSAPTSVAAQEDGTSEPQTVLASEQTDVEITSDIDTLLTDLKRQREPDTAQGIAARIFTLWSQSDSATVNLLMQWANDAISEKRNAAALDFLDQAIVLKPDFAGAWNRRATLHYTMGSLAKSMSDINHVLALEPRHFGALAGMASILGDSGRDEMALKAWERYLEIYPTDREAQDVVTKLSEKLAGSRT